jgi:hypothetical protein
LRWAIANPGKKNAETAKRRAAKKQAMPPWANPRELQAVYIECRRMTAETGIPHHVDHIHPLQSEEVCGLHVPWNLQIIPAAENARKSNKMIL